ncbi:hypothetical protein JWE25_20040, partial [Acinetobacter baumannii]|nr:hypothetical protein [Acinetobacter baumannii]
MHEGGQSRLNDSFLRTVAEEIRSEEHIGPGLWSTLRRKSLESGFGRFDDAGNLQIYRPYLEQCVAYEPAEEELALLMPILERLEDYAGMQELAVAYRHNLGDSDRALEYQDRVLELKPDFSLG